MPPAKRNVERNGEEIANTEEQEVTPQQRRKPPTLDEVQSLRARSLTVSTRNLSLSLAESLQAAELLDEQVILLQRRIVVLQAALGNRISELEVENKQLKEEIAGLKGEPTTDQPLSQQPAADHE